MKMSQSINLSQSQSLVMTPQLQQAIKLLQMSNQDLSQFVAEEIEKNPLLECPEEGGEHYILRQSVGAEEQKNAPQNNKEEQAEKKPEPVLEKEESYDASPQGGDSPRTDTNLGLASGRSYEDGFSALQNIAVEESLREHLLAQIHMDIQDPSEKMVAVFLLEQLDEAGYLPDDLTQICDQLGIEKEFLEKVLFKLQRFDPPGIFARCLKECLAIQLREKNRLDPAMIVLLDNLALLAKHDKAALKRICNVDDEDLTEMIQEVRELDPKPATAFTVDVSPTIIPDAFLRRSEGMSWSVELNNETLPRVLACETYYTTVQKTARVKEEKDYLTEHWQQANWLVKALHQRATTILKVAAEIVRRQDEFFTHGVQYLKPLVLRDVAEAVEMHESTISRVTQNKYIATPRGVFELKYFFSGAIATTGGEEMVSSLAVRDRIKTLIESEGGKNILSDEKLSILLRGEGIDIARRTVAKYREAMRIPSSAERRRAKQAMAS